MFSSSQIPWDSFFVGALPQDTEGFLVHVVDTCGTEFSYLVNGPKALYLGKEETKSGYEYLQQNAEFAEFARWDGSNDEDSFIIHCSYSISVCPTEEFKAVYESNEPVVYMIMTIMVFFFTTMVFVVYDCTVQRRQNRVMATATKTSAIVSSLFPKAVQERILKDAEEQETGRNGMFGFAHKQSSFIAGPTSVHTEPSATSRPIADLYPEATVAFMDIVGFTAWSCKSPFYYMTSRRTYMLQLVVPIQC